MKRWLWALPLLLLLVFAVIAGWRLTHGPQEKTDSFAPASGAVLDRPVPAGRYGVLYASEGDTFQFAGRPMAVNLFASWCTPCRAEHGALMELSKVEGAALVGVLYKDTPENGAGFLGELGNPYQVVIEDGSGMLGLDFGITGVPETFLVTADGRIVAHYRGPLDAADTEEIRAFFAR